MKAPRVSLFWRFLREQEGQTIAFFGFAMLAMLGVGGFLIDLGRFYVVRTQLQMSTNAAGLAAAGSVWNNNPAATASAIANNYITYNPASGIPENRNYPLITTPCLNVLTATNSGCSNDSNGNANPITTANAVRVTEQVSMPTWFMRLFGTRSLITQATATASMEGPAQPWNVAVILDATGSMATADSNCNNLSQEQCALSGVQQLLAATAPCAGNLTGSNCTPAGANFRVALFSFPNMVTSALPIANSCTGTVSTASYQVSTLPIPGVVGYTPLTYTQGTGATQTSWTASYEITPPSSLPGAPSDVDANGFVSDYYDSSNTTTGGLNPNSSLVKAVGYSGTSTRAGCLPVSEGGIDINGATNVGSTIPHITSGTNGGTQPTNTTIVNTMGVGEGITDFAPAIYAAQSALAAEKVLHPGSQNAIILLSDGQANTQWIYFPQGTMKPASLTNTYSFAKPATSTSTNSVIQSAESTMGYTYLNTTPNLNAYVAQAYTSPTSEYSALAANSGLYPDFIDECQQAIIAGQYAASQQTRIYSVAYGSETTGCANYSGAHAQHYTDVTLLPGADYPETLNQPFTLSGSNALNPCLTMKNIASSLDYFFSDYNQSGSGVDTNCIDGSHTVSTLKGIFQAIAASFTTPRLLPNNAT